MSLRAAWLGSWKAPWPQSRGRRWGDAAWTLQALAQAWLLGGKEGRWPQVAWTARRPEGPRPGPSQGPPLPLPDPAWVALLRHGSAALPADRRGPQEDELEAWCWEALLQGDADPWMAAGTVRLDKATRLRWVALLGAAAPAGDLQLPPFLQPLVPPGLGQLPPGWWERLLGSMDAEGRLLPSGDLPLDLPWEALRPHLDPLVLGELPPALRPFQGGPWLVPLPGLGWMLDPALRAWGRGWGAAPPALAALQPPALALGDPGEGLLGEILQGRPPGLPAPSEAWRLALRHDAAGEGPRPPCPPSSGHPTLDRVRVRWGGEAPDPAEGYPAWGTRAHPCADPFHWMAEGFQSYARQDLETALRAFTLAHAHFERLRAPDWAQRSASNAALAALHWADLQANQAWQALQGPMPGPLKDLQALLLQAARGEWGQVEPRLRGLLKAQPDLEPAWNLLAEGGLTLQRPEWIREALPHLGHPGVRAQMAACLAGWQDPVPPDLAPQQQVHWTLHRVLRGLQAPDTFWPVWEACPSHLLRLEAGLDFLEALPGERNPERLLALQAIERRADIPAFRERLAALWPRPGLGPGWGPRDPVEAVVAKIPGPFWLAWGEGGNLQTLGHGAKPPEGLLPQAHQLGGVAPLEAAGHVWWAFPLAWEGARVATALVGRPPGAPLDTPLEAGLLAPWIAALIPAPPPPPPAPEGALLADGSEPMATVLRELDRVAPSALSVLILGPTGSGKELVARELHRRSQRPGRLVAINVSAFSESLLESELFGHVKGAFTGADRDRAGAIESASGGTLFLDEVADLSPRLQSMLLRVLQEREVRKVGSDKAVKVDVRFVSATHRALEDLVEAGRFRRDLLFRLQGTVLDLPSLAARRHEFPYLIPRLVSQVAREARRDAPPLHPGLAAALQRLPWTGNFRELRHALERAMLRCGEGPLAPGHFPELEAPLLESRTWEEATRAFQRKLLLDTLRQHGFRAAEAAQALGLARPALYTTAKRLGVDLRAERMR